MNRTLAAILLASASLTSSALHAGAACIDVENTSGLYDWGIPPAGDGIHMRGFVNPLTQRVRVYGQTRTAPGGVSTNLHCWEWDGLAWQELDAVAGLGQFVLGAPLTAAVDPDAGVALVAIKLEALLRTFVIDLETETANVIFDEYAIASWLVHCPDLDAFLMYAPARGLTAYDADTGAFTLLHPPVAGMPDANTISAVYDAANRRVVLVGGNTTFRTIIYSLDDNAFTTLPAAANPPVAAAIHNARLVYNDATQEVNLVAVRSSEESALPREFLYRLSPDNQWVGFFGFNLVPGSTIPLAPVPVFDTAHHEIVFFGGQSKAGPGFNAVDIDTTSRIAFDAPSLRHLPADVVTPVGAPLTLSVAPAANARFTTVRWYHNDTLVAMTPDAILPLGDASPEHAGEWIVELAGGCGTAFSEPFQVAVTNAPITCPGDSNGDSVITFSDLNAVLGAFGQNCPE